MIVAPAPGEAGRLPFWRGDGPGRPIELGRALGRFTRELVEHETPEAWLRAEHALDEYAAKNLVDYVSDQREWTGTVPTDRRITIERFRDELGDWRLCILSPFGARSTRPGPSPSRRAWRPAATSTRQGALNEDGPVGEECCARRQTAAERIVRRSRQTDDPVLLGERGGRDLRSVCTRRASWRRQLRLWSRVVEPAH